jgi:hypothetical protein
MGGHASIPFMVGGAQVFPGGAGGMHLGMSRAYPYEELATQTRKCRVIYVDSGVDTTHKDYRDGTGDSWRNAYATIQAGINAARYDHGTTDICYDDSRDYYVIVAPGQYAERVAFSAKNVHLIGAYPMHSGGDTGVHILPASPTTGCFICVGTGSYIANIAVINDGTTVPGMYLGAEASLIENCFIDYGGTTPVNTNGITVVSTGLKNSSIVGCSICGFENGIYGNNCGYVSYGQIARNTIDCQSGNGTSGIYFATTASIGYRVWQNAVGIGYPASINIDNAGIMVYDNWCYAQPTASGATIRDNHYSGAGA